MFPMLHLHFNCWCRRLRVAVPTVAKSSFTRTCRTHAHTHTLTGTKGHTDNRTIVSGSSASSACFPFPLHEIPTTSSQLEGENPSLLMPQLPVVVLVVGFPLRQQIKRKSATFRTLAATEGSKTGHRCC